MATMTTTDMWTCRCGARTIDAADEIRTHIETNHGEPHTHRSCFATGCDLDHNAIDAELRATPHGRGMLAENEMLGYDLIHAVITRHNFHDHDCQTTGCLTMFLWNSDELTKLLVDAYERGRTDGSADACEGNTTVKNDLGKPCP